MTGRSLVLRLLPVWAVLVALLLGMLLLVVTLVLFVKSLQLSKEVARAKEEEETKVQVENERRRREYEHAHDAWKRAMSRWQRLFYCSRCDGVFVAGDGVLTPLVSSEFALRDPGRA